MNELALFTLFVLIVIAYEIFKIAGVWGGF